MREMSQTIDGVKSTLGWRKVMVQGKLNSVFMFSGIAQF